MLRSNVKNTQMFCLFVTVFRPFHNVTFLKHSCLEDSIVKLKAKYRKVCFAVLFKIISTIRNTTLITKFLPKGLVHIRLQEIVTIISILQVLYMILIFCTFHGEKLDTVKRKAFHLFKTDVESKLCHLFAL